MTESEIMRDAILAKLDAFEKAERGAYDAAEKHGRETERAVHGATMYAARCFRDMVIDGLLGLGVELPEPRPVGSPGATARVPEPLEVVRLGLTDGDAILAKLEVFQAQAVIDREEARTLGRDLTRNWFSGRAVACEFFRRMVLEAAACASVEADTRTSASAHTGADANLWAAGFEARRVELARLGCAEARENEAAARIDEDGLESPQEDEVGWDAPAPAKDAPRPASSPREPSGAVEPADVGDKAGEVGL